jgi:hypothetical protein
VLSVGRYRKFLNKIYLKRGFINEACIQWNVFIIELLIETSLKWVLLSQSLQANQRTALNRAGSLNISSLPAPHNHLSFNSILRLESTLGPYISRNRTGTHNVTSTAQTVERQTEHVPDEQGNVAARVVGCSSMYSDYNWVRVRLNISPPSSVPKSKQARYQRGSARVYNCLLSASCSFLVRFTLRHWRRGWHVPLNLKLPFIVTQELQARADLLPGKEPPVSVGYETGWAPDSISTTWRSDNSWPCQDLNSDSSVLQRVASRCTDCATAAPPGRSQSLYRLRYRVYECK